ncbi:MAG: glucose-6-phosphate dehydrogenase assembly protein OpcA [Oscillatoriales cyanobacterium SM2_2_1]|nr:glucose-6-phosphate dehydrogenase assembly protein OpcA [Oscillatoriales cyanobacterium SM2_2_1]
MVATPQTPIVSLQAPKDVLVTQIEAELAKIWQSYGENAAARATTFNLVVIESAQMSVQDRMAAIDAIASQSPCRVLDLLPSDDGEEEITAQVAAYCPIQKTRSSLICGEYITLKGSPNAFERIPALVSELLIHDLPIFLWYKCCPDFEHRLFAKLHELSDRVIVDSACFTNPEADLIRVHQCLQADIPIADLNWQRLAPWQELTAQAFDPPERRSAAWEIDNITIDYERGNSTQAWLFLGWLASRLAWQPVTRIHVGGEYSIDRLEFRGRNDLSITAELAALPMADVGDVVGDLVGFKLTSSNPGANVCNVFCSQSTGCVRMEASGGAQVCQIHQVSPLSDQRADALLGQQLQRWGQDVLFEESLSLAVRTLSLNP